MPNSRVLCFTLALPFLCTFLTGCGTEWCARNLLEVPTGAGQVAEAMAGSGRELLAARRIDRAMTVAAQDGAELDVWVIQARDPAGEKTMGRPAGTVVLLHGLTASKAFYLSLGERLARARFDVVLLDHRRHGRSGGAYITWGAQERRDVKTVVDRCLGDGIVHQPLMVFGVSMGAAVAIDYAADDPRCRAVLAVAPPQDIHSVAGLMYRLLGKEDLDAVVARAARIGSFDPRQASALESAKRLACPILLVHGRADMVVPFEHSEHILAAVPGRNKQLIAVPMATHLSVMWGREEWFVDQVQTLLKTGDARMCK